MPLRRALMVSAAGVAVVIVQAFVLGNQWVAQWAYDHEDFLGSGFGAFLKSVLFFPRWRLTPGGSFKFMLVIDLGLAVLLVLLATFTALGVMRLDPTRDMVAAFISGWWAAFLAGAIAASVTQVLGGIVLDFSAQIRFAVAGGLEYGFAAGPVLGAAVMGAYLLTRPAPAPAPEQ